MSLIRGGRCEGLDPAVALPQGALAGSRFLKAAVSAAFKRERKWTPRATLFCSPYSRSAAQYWPWQRITLFSAPCFPL